MGAIQNLREDKDVGVDTTSGHPDMDYSEHLRTYEGFLRLTKFIIAAIVVLLVGMKIFLV
ncbi:MAG: aa3-type cytochrome c oxidase subunit IV [Hyphomicrobium sp.]